MQRHGHHPGHVGDVGDATLAEVVRQRQGHRRHERVVHRAVEGLRDRLDRREADPLGPRDALVDVGMPAPRAGIGLLVQQQSADLAPRVGRLVVVRGEAGEYIDEFGGVPDQVEGGLKVMREREGVHRRYDRATGLGHERTRVGHRIDGVLDRVLRKVPDRIERAMRSAVAAPSHGVRRRAVGGVARPDEQLHEAYAVAEPVVEAGEHRSPALVLGRPRDQLHVPQRARPVEGHRELAGDIRAQGLGLGVGEDNPQHVPVHREVDVVLPLPMPVVLDGHLAQQAVLRHHALEDGVAQRLPLGKFVEGEQAVDMHQVVGPIHQQPGEVGRRDPGSHPETFLMSPCVVAPCGKHVARLTPSVAVESTVRHGLTSRPQE